MSFASLPLAVPHWERFKQIKKKKNPFFFSGTELIPLRSPASVQPSPIHRKSPQLSISTPLALQSVQSDGKDSFADDIEPFIQFF